MSMEDIERELAREKIAAYSRIMNRLVHVSRICEILYRLLQNGKRIYLEDYHYFYNRYYKKCVWEWHVQCDAIGFRVKPDIHQFLFVPPHPDTIIQHIHTTKNFPQKEWWTMSDLLQKIENDFKNALREHKKDVAQVLRLIKTELKYATVDKGTSLTEEEIFAILNRMVKKRRDAIEIYKKAGRDEHIQQELFEIEIIEHYLPRELTKEDVLPLIQEVIESVQARGPKDFGKVMGQVMKRLKGQRVDARAVREWIQSALEQHVRSGS